MYFSTHVHRTKGLNSEWMGNSTKKRNVRKAAGWTGAVRKPHQGGHQEKWQASLDAQ